MQDNDFLDYTKFQLETTHNSKTTFNLKTHKQPDIEQKQASPHCPYEATTKGHLKIEDTLTICT